MKNKILTVIITIIFSFISVLYALGIIKAMTDSNINVTFIIMVVIIMALFIVALIWNMIKRFKEIKKEEKDDISKY